MQVITRSLVLWSLALVGCPSDDGTEPDTTVAEGTSTASTTTQGSATSATSQGTTTSATSQGTTTAGDNSQGSADSDSGDMLCPVVLDEPSPGAVQIELVNMRAEGVWLPLDMNCFESVPWSMTTPDGTMGAWRNPACGTCEGAAVGDCPCPPPFCDELTGLFLEAGASTQYTWSGALFVDDVIAETCPGIDECGSNCARAVAPAAGTYTFSVQAGTAVGCNGGGDCDCTPSDGTCTVLDYDMMFEMLVDVEAELVLPGESVVQLVIE